MSHLLLFVLRVLTVTMCVMLFATATPDISCSSCSATAQVWTEEMRNATGPPCPDQLQADIDAMYWACGNCPVPYSPNFWNVSAGTSWDDTNNATKNAVEVYGCSAVSATATPLALSALILMCVLVASITVAGL